MKRLRLERWSGQLTQAQSQIRCRPCLTARQVRPQQSLIPIRLQSTTAIPGDSPVVEPPEISLPGSAAAEHLTPTVEGSQSPYPSPLPEAALESAKLAALHARLCLSSKLPLQTLARALVDPTADENPSFNNLRLAYLGGTVINYHASEWLIAKYPRLPMSVLFEAMRGYAGSESLYHVGKGWGVESAAAPGGEVDPGLLQWSDDISKSVTHQMWGYVRTEANKLDKFKWRRGWSSRVIYDDPFGDTVHVNQHKENSSTPQLPSAIIAEKKTQYEFLRNNAYSGFVRALVGSIYLHCGREMAKAFVKAHILSRNLEVDKMFTFHAPLIELSKLCAREGFDRPVARLESETGRLSRTPVYVVGIYSGKDKLGEGVGPSLNFARWKASMNALKAWYLYSPSAEPRVPSDMLVEGAKAWQAPYVDIGEVML